MNLKQDFTSLYLVHCCVFLILTINFGFKLQLSTQAQTMLWSKIFEL
jgi:hypothetical protein